VTIQYNYSLNIITKTLKNTDWMHELKDWGKKRNRTSKTRQTWRKAQRREQWY